MRPTWLILKNNQVLRGSYRAFKVLRVELLHTTPYFELSKNQGPDERYAAMDTIYSA